MQPLSLKNLNHTELQSQKTGEKFSLSALVSDHFGFKDIFIHHEVLSPGRRSSSAHSHSHREELVVVTKGNPTAVFKGEQHRLSEGDFFGFPPGEGNSHYLMNETNEQIEMLVIASNPPKDEVIYTEKEPT